MSLPNADGQHTVHVLLMSGEGFDVQVCHGSGTGAPRCIDVKESIQQIRGLAVSSQLLSAEERIFSDLETVPHEVLLVATDANETYAKALLGVGRDFYSRRWLPQSVREELDSLAPDVQCEASWIAWKKYADFISGAKHAILEMRGYCATAPHEDLCNQPGFGRDQMIADSPGRSLQVTVSPDDVKDYVMRAVDESVAHTAAQRRDAGISDRFERELFQAQARLPAVAVLLDYFGRATSVQDACREAARRDSLITDPDEANVLSSWPGNTSVD
eukprot:TRINITY_DN18467_c0_g1_i2.p1 TRINITY_DN18467_c0_g1~~TRINITY_DN18467_c0_g1_i2.p1  ORF type:complete len:273 (-),score=43.17 TRINITY_DN18467_c0_g1_i2:107-925(-)